MVVVVVEEGVGVVPAPRTETRTVVPVDRRTMPVRLKLEVHTAQSPERVESSGIQPEITQNDDVTVVNTTELKRFRFKLFRSWQWQ